MSIAVLALIGASAHKHHHQRHPHHRSNVQFVEGDLEDDTGAITEQSIAESEKEHGAKMAVLDEDHYK
jgi:cephalosporin hydroxylase